MSTQDNASGGDNNVTRTSSGGAFGHTSNPEEIARLAESIVSETDCTMVRFTLEPVRDNHSGAAGARGGSSGAGVGSLPRSDFATVTSSGGVMGVSNGPARAAQAAPETEPAPADMNGDLAAQVKSQRVEIDALKKIIGALIMESRC